MILIHTADLMFAVRIDSTARGLGYATAPIRTLERLRERFAEAGLIDAAAVDRDASSSSSSSSPTAAAAAPNAESSSEETPIIITGFIVEVDPDSISLDLIREARRLVPDLPIIAFGPHVLVDLLKAAGEAGASDVMTRGKFTGHLIPILQHLEGTAEAG